MTESTIHPEGYVSLSDHLATTGAPDFADALLTQPADLRVRPEG